MSHKERACILNLILRIKEEFITDQKLVFIRLEIGFPKAYPFLEQVSSEQFKSAKSFPSYKNRTRLSSILKDP